MLLSGTQSLTCRTIESIKKVSQQVSANISYPNTQICLVGMHPAWRSELHAYMDCYMFVGTPVSLHSVLRWQDSNLELLGYQSIMEQPLQMRGQQIGLHRIPLDAELVVLLSGIQSLNNRMIGIHEEKKASQQVSANSLYQNTRIRPVGMHPAFIFELCAYKYCNTYVCVHLNIYR